VGGIEPELLSGTEHRIVSFKAIIFLLVFSYLLISLSSFSLCNTRRFMNRLPSGMMPVNLGLGRIRRSANFTIFLLSLNSGVKGVIYVLWFTNFCLFSHFTKREPESDGVSLASAICVGELIFLRKFPETDVRRLHFCSAVALIPHSGICSASHVHLSCAKNPRRSER
jgi:hypothetical protein